MHLDSWLPLCLSSCCRQQGKLRTSWQMHRSYARGQPSAGKLPATTIRWSRGRSIGRRDNWSGKLRRLIARASIAAAPSATRVGGDALERIGRRLSRGWRAFVDACISSGWTCHSRRVSSSEPIAPRPYCKSLFGMRLKSADGDAAVGLAAGRIVVGAAAGFASPSTLLSLLLFPLPLPLSEASTLLRGGAPFRGDRGPANSLSLLALRLGGG